MSTTTHCNKCGKKKKEKDNDWSKVWMWDGIPKEYSDTIGRNNDFCANCTKDFFKLVSPFFKE